MKRFDAENVALMPNESTHCGIDVSRMKMGPARPLSTRTHRIIVHESAATWTTCTATGLRHLRRRGDIDIVPSGEAQGFEADTAYDALEIALPPKFLERAMARIGEGRGRSGLQAWHMLRNPRIYHLAMAALQGSAGQREDMHYLEAIGQALASQLSALSRQEDHAGNRLSQAQLRRVVEYIEKNIDTALTIDVLAREAGASSSHLRHWFKQATGTTLHRYVIAKRIEKARALLEQGELSRSEVALAAGFAHQSHMSRWFRREGDLA